VRGEGATVVVYDRQDQPFTDQEYVVNLYVGDKGCICRQRAVRGRWRVDSLPSQGDPAFAPPEAASTLQVAPARATANRRGLSPLQPSADRVKVASGDCGIRILALVVVVAWAEGPATRA
jgi:hypothetical protein